MSNLQHRQSKIQEKRKQTPWREFVMEIASSYNLMFYKNHGLVSRFPETPRCGPLYTPNNYLEKFGDGTDGIEYDHQKSFFDNFVPFYQSTPKMAQIHYGVNEGCEYAETVFGAKNGYLSVCIGDSAENVLYSTMCYSNIRNVYNSVLITSNSENIYYCKLVTDSFNIFYSKYIHNSNNIRFCDNCIGCAECISCSGLENQSYHINNQPFSKEEYFAKKSHILSKKHEFITLYNQVNNAAHNKVISNCSGSGIQFCESVENGHLISRFKVGRNIAFADGTPVSNEVFDSFDVGYCDKTYGRMGCGQGCDNMYCGANASASSNMYYSYFMESCSFCLGCIGLKNKSYCILNKQYSKDEWYEKVDEIFAQMEADGTLGQFFPPNMNPFYFNDTAAYLIDPSFTKEEVTAAGYLRRDEPIKVDIPANAEVVKTSELGKYEGWVENAKDAKNGEKAFETFSTSASSSASWYIDPIILKKIIQDPEGNVYRIVPMEYDFLMKYGLPLPRKHWLDRMRENFRIA